MKLLLKIIIFILLLAGLTLGAVKAYRTLQARKGSKSEEQIIVKVRVQPVRRGDIEHYLALTGDLQALATVEVMPEISGRLERLSLEDGTPVDEGVEVKKGELIAVIEHDSLAADVERARAALEVAKAALAKALVARKDREREKRRMENLFKQGAATERQRDEAVTSYEKAVADVELCRAEIKQAEAALRLAQTRLEDAFIRAPISGVVCRKDVDVGDMVNTNTSIVCIVRIDELKLLVDVPGVHLTRIKPNVTTAEVEVDAYPGKKFPAIVSKVYPVLQEETRTARLEIRLKNPREGEKGWAGYMLRPGMYASVRVHLETRRNVIVVPADSLIRRVDVYYAFIVEGDRAKRLTVQPGLWSGNLVEIKHGLKEGQLLVVRGQSRLTDGLPVQVMGKEGSS